MKDECTLIEKIVATIVVLAMGYIYGKAIYSLVTGKEYLDNMVFVAMTVFICAVIFINYIYVTDKGDEE